MANKTPQEKWDKVLGFISEGMNNKGACLLAGVGESTFYDHIKESPEFSESLKKAEQEFLKTHLDKITQADQWQAHAWILERRFPDQFKERKSMEFENGLILRLEDAAGSGTETNTES